MHGICFEYDLQDWFDFKIPKTKIEPDYIISCLEKEANFNVKPSAKIIWIGGKPKIETFIKSKKGNSWDMMTLTFYDKKETFTIQTNKTEGEWLVSILEKAAIFNNKINTFQEIKIDFESHFEDFELFWFSKPLNTLREFGLLVL